MYKLHNGDAHYNKGMWMNLNINFGKYSVISALSKHSWAPAHCTVK
jgi:hypothetical protein